MRLPPGRAWGVVHFTGGAVLGSYPHIAYDALLSEVADSGAAPQTARCRTPRLYLHAVAAPAKRNAVSTPQTPSGKRATRGVTRASACAQVAPLGGSRVARDVPHVCR